MSELSERLVEAREMRNLENAVADYGLTDEGVTPEPGTIIEGQMTPTGWGVRTSGGLVYAATPCCASELIYDDVDRTNRCLSCWQKLDPPCEPALVNVAGPFDPRELQRLVAQWSGYTEAGTVVMRQIVRVSV